MILVFIIPHLIVRSAHQSRSNRCQTSLSLPISKLIDTSQMWVINMRKSAKEFNGWPLEFNKANGKLQSSHWWMSEEHLDPTQHCWFPVNLRYISDTKCIKIRFRELSIEMLKISQIKNIFSKHYQLNLINYVPPYLIDCINNRNQFKASQDIIIYETIISSERI